MKVHAIVAGLLSTISIMAGAANVSAASRPYCIGNCFWSWTPSTENAACTAVFQRCMNANRTITRGYWGTYDNQGLNRGDLICDQGRREVLGSGSAVFENGLNMARQLNWKNCAFRIK